MIVSSSPSIKSFHLQRPLCGVVACFAFCTLTSQALTLTGVQSRKTHLSGVGVLDLPIDTTQPMSGNVTVEPRVIGSGGHNIVFQFDGPITSMGTLAVVDNTLSTVTGATAMISLNDVQVNLPVLADNKRVRITLSNVNGIGLNSVVSLGFLVGDVNNSLSVNSSDISGVKARSGLTTTVANFKFDLNASGAINSSDISAVKARSGLVMPIVNALPVVNAGANQSITLPASAALVGTATDDGLPNPPGALTLLWSKFSGPGTVTFGNTAAASTSASFSIASTYVLRLSANDGQATGSADVSIAVSPDPTVLPGLFEKPHAWNQDVSALPISLRSAAITGALQSLGGWGNGNKLQIDFSIPVMTANGATPRRTITAAPGGYCYGGPDCDVVPLQMPIPANGNTEGSVDYTCDPANNDCHVLVVETAEKKLYELYNATAVGSTTFTALGAFVWDLTKQYPDVLRGDQCTSADAAGLPMAALIPTADEVAAGDVPHALRFILPNPRMKAGVYVRPATHAGGPSSLNVDAPPYGVRLRLKSSFVETTFSSGAQVILRALKKHGMILSDGGNIALTFADDRLSTAKWATLGIAAQTFNNIPVSQFDVVDLVSEIPLTFNCVRVP